MTEARKHFGDLDKGRGRGRRVEREWGERERWRRERDGMDI